jgi:arginine decarboxylase
MCDPLDDPRDPRLQDGDADLLPLDRMPGTVVGVGLLPYPPGIPMVMPGERLGDANGAWIS